MKITVFIASIIISLFLSACQQNTPGSSEAATTDSKTKIEKQALVPVEALILREKPIDQRLELTGTLEPFHEVDIIAEVSGKVTKVQRELGNRVTTADTLARIDDKIPHSQFMQAKAQVMSAQNNVQIAELNLKSDHELFKNGDISKLAYENSELNLKNAQASLLSAKANFSLMEKQYYDTRITSPIKGFISRKYISLGTMVNTAMPVYRVVDLSKLKITVGVSQDVVKLIRAGSPVTVYIAALNEEISTAKVAFISPQADAATGAFNTEIHLQNSADLKIKAGMTARVSIALRELRERLAVPDYSLVRSNGQRSVYKIIRDTAKLVPVTVAETVGDEVVIGSGLAAGDTIVVVGMKNLGIDTKVQIETIQ